MPGVAEIKPYGKDGYVAFTQLGVRQDFAQDLLEEEADVVYAVQGPLAARCFDDKISTAAWHVSCVRSGALDHGSEYPGRWWVETLRYGIYLAKGDFDGEEDRGEQQEACLGGVRHAVQ